MAKRLPPRRKSAPPAGTNAGYALEVVSDDALDRSPDADGEDGEQTVVTEEEKRELARKAAIVARGKRKLKLSLEAYGKQRQREAEDVKFSRGFTEDQWPADILKTRLGETDGEGGRVSTPRPCLVIDKLSVPRRHVMNEARTNKLSIRVRAKAGRSSKEKATIAQAAVRAIEDDSRANIARLWALEQVSMCGRGYYRVLTKYANDRDRDLDIVVSRILNQHSVHPDPWHKEPDGSDMQFCLITEDIPRREFPNRYPNSTLAKRILAARKEHDGSDGELDDPLDVDDSSDTGNELAAEEGSETAWVTESTVRVAEFFEVEYERRTKLFVDDGAGGYAEVWKDEVPDGVMVTKKTPSREIVTPKVKWYLITANELLDEEDWPGRYIPVVQVLGEEYNVKGERAYKGITSSGKDVQRSYNYHRSKQVETVGLAPVAPFIAAEGQTEDFPEWETANTVNHAVLKYRPTSHEGHLVGAPQRNVAEPAIQAVTLAAQSADADLKDVTGYNDPSLGRNPKNQSGKAIEALQAQGSRGNSHYVTNLAEVSMAFETKIILDLLPSVYDRPGRMMKLLGERGEESEAPIGVPFVQAPGGPMPLPPGTPPGTDVPLPNGKVKKVKLYQFTHEDEFSVSVGVGPSAQTEKDGNREAIGTMMTAVPALAPIMADYFAKTLDGDIADDLAVRLKAAQPAIAGMDDDEDDTLPPEAQAKIQGMSQQMAQMQQQLQALTQQVQTKQAEKQADMQIAQAAAQSRERIAAMTTSASLAIAKLGAAGKMDTTELDAITKQAMQEAEHAHERVMLRLEQQVGAEAAARETTEAREQHRDTLAADMVKHGMKEEADERKDERKAVNTRRDNAQKAALAVATRPPEKPKPSKN